MMISKTNFIKDYVLDKSVLDIGCVGGNKTKVSDMHMFLHGNTSFVLGIDVQKERVNSLKNDVYNVEYGNVYSYKPNRKFDVIFAGDILEHLSNPDMFFNNMKSIMNKNTILIIITPNCYSSICLYNYFISGYEGKHWRDRIIKKDKVYSGDGFGHIILYSRYMMERMFLRYKFSVVDFCFSYNYKKGIRGYLTRFIGNLLPIFAESMIYVIKKCDLDGNNVKNQ